MTNASTAKSNRDMITRMAMMMRVADIILYF